MKPAHISYGFGLRDFNDYGINFLTGEACGYGGRILADLTFDGVATMIEFLGGNIDFRAKTAWNAGISSMMIPRGMIGDLAVFCLIQAGNEVVIHRPDYTVVGYTLKDWMAEDEDGGGTTFRDRYFAAYPGCKVYHNSGTAGTRNRHEFTGRTI